MRAFSTLVPRSFKSYYYLYIFENDFSSSSETGVRAHASKSSSSGQKETGETWNRTWFCDCSTNQHSSRQNIVYVINDVIGDAIVEGACRIT